MQEMQDIERGRSTARTDDDLILFLIGMRVNRAWRLDKWWWVYRSMKRMVRYLKTNPEAGLIHSQRWLGRTTMQVSYWRSFDHLLALAADNAAPHAPAWRKFAKQATASDVVGIYHETYVVSPGENESVYVSMPTF